MILLKGRHSPSHPGPGEEDGADEAGDEGDDGDAAVYVLNQMRLPQRALL